ncbi:hypothetical protein Prudu_009406, partial [Prunus dulcis]
AVRPFAFSATAGHHRPSRSPPWVPSGPPPCRRHNLTNLHPRAALSWPENHVSGGGSFEATRTSSSKFSFVSPPNRSSKASEVQPTSRRNLQRAVEVCGIHHRAIHSFRASKPGVGHAQDLARIPKWKLGRVLSEMMKIVKNLNLVGTLCGTKSLMLWGCVDRKEKGGCDKEKTIERKEEMGRATGDQCRWREEGGSGGCWF